VLARFGILNIMLFIIFVSLLKCLLLADCQRISGVKDYVEFFQGNMNIIISVAHGGYLLPSSITDRPSDPLANVFPDRNTIEIATVIRDTMSALFFNSTKQISEPFMIVNNLNRNKMDPNRNMTECCAVPTEDSFIAYNEFHDFIRTKFIFEFLSTRTYKQALLLDIHGQSHKENWIELGYVLTKQMLNNDDKLRDPTLSSVCSMSATSEFLFDDIIRGDDVSLGAIIRKNNIELTVCPSPNVPSPKSGNYYNGGYISVLHGSKGCTGSIVNAIQVELPSFVRTNETYSAYAKSLAQSFYEFYMVHKFNEKNGF
jgi:hypothetical protein